MTTIMYSCGCWLVSPELFFFDCSTDLLKKKKLRSMLPLSNSMDHRPKEDLLQDCITLASIIHGSGEERQQNHDIVGSWANHLGNFKFHFQCPNKCKCCFVNQSSWCMCVCVCSLQRPLQSTAQVSQSTCTWASFQTERLFGKCSRQKVLYSFSQSPSLSIYFSLSILAHPDPSSLYVF